ncbi:hypothetical protein [Rickettsia felis]|nr:hypothetical protein [Rickettsia felis]
MCLRLPASYNNYYEPFVGEGALFFLHSFRTKLLYQI